MTLTAGALSKVSVTSSTASLLSAVATSGTSPYTYQWYRDTSASTFTPGAGNLISGATNLTLADSGLVAGVTYFYKVVVTDAASATATSAALTVALPLASLSQNQFALVPFLGMTDLKFNANTLSVMFDPTGSGSLVAGQAVKFTTTAGGVPQVVPSTLQADKVAGFVNYDIKSQSFSAGDKLEISMAGNVMFLMATAAINRGSQVCSIPSAVAGGTIGGLVAATGSSGFPKVGFALDTAVAGQLVRVHLSTPAFTVDA